MNRIPYIVILILINCLPASSQTKHDSLYDVYQDQSDPLDKGLTLEKLFLHTMFSDFDTSKYYVQKIIDLGRVQKLDTLLKVGYKRLSTHYLVTSQYQASDSISRLLDPMIDSTDMSDMAQQHYMNRGNYYYLTNQYAKAAEQFTKVRKICAYQNYSSGLASVNGNIGNCFKQIEDYEKALEYYLPSYDYFINISNTSPKLISLCTSIGETYIKLGDRSTGKKFIIQSLEVAEKNNRHLNICLNSNNLAVFYLEDNELAEAKKYLDKSTNLSLEKELWREHIFAIKTTGLYYLKLNNYAQSIKYSQEAITLSEEKKITSQIETAYQNLYKAYNEKGDHKQALANLLIANELKDSIFSLEKNNEIHKLSLKYDSAVKDAEITSKDLKIQKTTNRQRLLIFASLLLGLMAISIFLFMRKSMKSNKKLADKDSLIKSQKINQLQKEKKILAMNAMLEGQEAERIRIAKDLHDGLGGLLATVKTRLTNINNEVTKIESYNIYEKTTSMVDDACDEVRRISHNLMPGALRLDGLKTAVQQLAVDLEEAHLFEVKVEIVGFDSKLDETKEIFLYRIIQEATNNIIKHAQAKNILVQLSESPKEYHLIIEDDGKGFDTNKENEGIGLKSIQSRVEYLQGVLDISSNLGEGTTICAHIPKAQHAAEKKDTDSR